LTVQCQLHLVDEAALDRARRGLMVETEEVWRQFFLREQIRVESQLDAQKATAGRG
jgi:hypothetical protein